EGTLGLQQVLVAQGDVLGAEVGVAGGQQELAIQLRLGLELGAVDEQPAAGGLAQAAAPGWGVAEGAFGLEVIVGLLLGATAAVGGGLGLLGGLGAQGGDPLQLGL